MFHTAILNRTNWISQIDRPRTHANVLDPDARSAKLEPRSQEEVMLKLMKMTVAVEETDSAKPARKMLSSKLVITPTLWDTQPTSIHTSQVSSHQTSTSSKVVSASNGSLIQLVELETIRTSLSSPNVSQLATNNGSTSTKCQEQSELTPDKTTPSQTLRELSGMEPTKRLSLDHGERRNTTCLTSTSTPSAQ